MSRLLYDLRRELRSAAPDPRIVAAATERLGSDEIFLQHFASDDAILTQIVDASDRCDAEGLLLAAVVRLGTDEVVLRWALRAPSSPVRRAIAARAHQDDKLDPSLCHGEIIEIAEPILSLAHGLRLLSDGHEDAQGVLSVAASQNVYSAILRDYEAIEDDKCLRLVKQIYLSLVLDSLRVLQADESTYAVLDATVYSQAMARRAFADDHVLGLYDMARQHFPHRPAPAVRMLHMKALLDTDDDVMFETFTDVLPRGIAAADLVAEGQGLVELPRDIKLQYLSDGSAAMHAGTRGMIVGQDGDRPVVMWSHSYAPMQYLTGALTAAHAPAADQLIGLVLSSLARSRRSDASLRRAAVRYAARADTRPAAIELLVSAVIASDDSELTDMIEVFDGPAVPLAEAVIGRMFRSAARRTETPTRGSIEVLSAAARMLSAQLHDSRAIRLVALVLRYDTLPLLRHVRPAFAILRQKLSAEAISQLIRHDCSLDVAHLRQLVVPSDVGRQEAARLWRAVLEQRHSPRAPPLSFAIECAVEDDDWSLVLGLQQQDSRSALAVAESEVLAHVARVVADRPGWPRLEPVLQVLREALTWLEAVEERLPGAHDIWPELERLCDFALLDRAPQADEEVVLAACHAARCMGTVCEILALRGRVSVVDRITGGCLTIRHFRASLHGNLRRNLAQKYDGLELDDFAWPARRSYGTDYVYSIDLADRALGANSFVRELATANLNLALADAQMRFLRGALLLMHVAGPRSSLVDAVLQVDSRAEPPEMRSEANVLRLTYAATSDVQGQVLADYFAREEPTGEGLWLFLQVLARSSTEVNAGVVLTLARRAILACDVTLLRAVASIAGRAPIRDDDLALRCLECLGRTDDLQLIEATLMLLPAALTDNIATHLAFARLLEARPDLCADRPIYVRHILPLCIRLSHSEVADELRPALTEALAPRLRQLAHFWTSPGTIQPIDCDELTLSIVMAGSLMSSLRQPLDDLLKHPRTTRHVVQGDPDRAMHEIATALRLLA